MKLVVEVVGAHDLPARRGRGGVSPFVQVDFGGQRAATGVKHGEVNPTWNETLVFAVDVGGGGGGGRLTDRAVDVTVYHRRASGSKSSLGRVRLFGAAVAPAAEEAVLLRCPLEKRSFFASARGEVVLRLYMARYTSAASAGAAAAGNAAAARSVFSTSQATTFDGAASLAGPETVVGGASTRSAPTTREKKKKNKEPPVHVFRAMPAESTGRSPAYPPRPPASFMPPPASKKATPAAKPGAYLMVDELEFLYVNVVRGRDLPGMDLTFGVDPYIEVRVGNYSGVTRHLVRNHDPEWNQVFAFSKEKLQANTVEVIVKDRNLVVRDGFVGKVSLPISEVPSFQAPNRPLAPQWYALKGANGQLTGGEIMVAAWKGLQTDEAFTGALHAGVHGDLAPAAVQATQTKTYHAPRLCYLRCHVIAAQDLVHPADRSRSSVSPGVFVAVRLGEQRWFTRKSPSLRNPKWEQDFFLVAAWPLEEPLEITVLDVVSPGRDEVLGRLVLPKGAIKTHQSDKHKVNPPAPSWFDLEMPNSDDNGDGDSQDRERRHEVRSKIQLQVYYDAAYHVLDELSTYASDFQPSARPLRSPAIGILELGVLRATGLPSKANPANGGSRSVNTYCVAKYGQKWIRTRTLRDTAAPNWQEQFTFDVFDPCTVLTVAVFDNNQLFDDGDHESEPSRRGAADEPLGKVRIRVSTLTSNRTYEHPYSLFVVRPNGLRRCGELHLAVRFTSRTSPLKMMLMYIRPTLPDHHLVKPIPLDKLMTLRRYAVDVVASRLARAEPPLRPEAVWYLLRDPSAHPNHAASELSAYSFRRFRATYERMRNVLAPAAAFAGWFRGVRDWKRPVTSVLVTVLFLTMTWKPRKILPTFFLYLFAVGAWNLRRRPTRPAQMEHYADGVHSVMLGEDFYAGPGSGPPVDTVVQWHWELLKIAWNVQNILARLAEMGERVQALLSWRDVRATEIALVGVAFIGILFYVVPFRAVVTVAGLLMLRPPLLRMKDRSPVVNFLERLPTNMDAML